MAAPTASTSASTPAQLSSAEQLVSDFLADILNLEAIEVGFNCFLTHRPEITKANEVKDAMNFILFKFEF